MLDKKLALSLYKKMILIRKFEEKTSELYASGKIPGFVHVYIGEEAIATGVCANLNADDYITSTHRGHGHIIAKGGDIKYMMAELFAKKEGYCKGKGGSMHICDLNLGILGSNGIVGAGFPIAAGAGYACKMEGKGNVCVCFFGDGASNRGTFHESLNFASTMKLPIVYVCENNFYGISGSQRELMNITNISERAKSYDIQGITANGNNIEEVYEISKEAIKKARDGEGPSLLEFKTWRHRGHYEGDPDLQQFIYRDKSEHNEWLKKDPIGAFKNIILKNKILAENELQEIEKNVDQAILEAVAFAEKSPMPDKDDLLKDIYA